MAAEKTKSVFETLNNINVNGHTESKNGLTYLSWAWAWAEVKKAYPDATYKIYEDFNGKFYHTDGRTCWVKTGVTIEGIEHIEYLPVMDFKNKSIPVESVTSFDVNKAIQRSLTKAVARHGLGLYIYAGEDLPEEEATEKKAKAEEAKRALEHPICLRCGKAIEPSKDKSGKVRTPAEVAAVARKYFNMDLCVPCQIEAQKEKEKKDE